MLLRSRYAAGISATGSKGQASTCRHEGLWVTAAASRKGDTACICLALLSSGEVERNRLSGASIKRRHIFVIILLRSTPASDTAV